MSPNVSTGVNKLICPYIFPIHKTTIPAPEFKIYSVRVRKIVEVANAKYITYYQNVLI